MRGISWAAPVLMMVMAACGSRTPPRESTDMIEQKMQRTLERLVADNDLVRGAALHVDSPTTGLSWTGGVGVADPEAGTAMTAGHPVRIASNTKTYVAAAILRLVEEGRMGLDDPIAAHLEDSTVRLLQGDGYRPEEMTIRHLLTHTSGLFDHSDSQKYGDAITADPQHLWTRDEQVAAAVEWGDPWGPPGTIYTYCDTGYVLLGGIVERVSGRPLQEAIRELLRFDELGLDSTWWETLEPAPDGVPDRAHQFLDDLDTHGFNPSFDLYGGGGLAATVTDMAVFYRALFTGRVFSDPGYAELMLTTIQGAQPRPDADESALPPGTYRMGVWVQEMAGTTVYAHSGFWGTAAIYAPELDLAAAVTVNQNKAKEAMWEVLGEAVAAASGRAS